MEMSLLYSGMTIEGFDVGITSMKKGEKAQLTIQAGYAIKPGRTTMDKMMPTGDGEEKPEPPPPTLPDVPENMMREDKVVFEVSLQTEVSKNILKKSVKRFYTNVD